MKHLLVCLTCLLFRLAIGQSCCATTGASSVSIGSNASSLLLKKGQLAVQTSAVNWGFEAMDQVTVVNTPIADVARVNIWTNAITYGLSSRWSLQFLQPYFWLKASFHGYNEAGKRILSDGNIQGFSDGIVLAKRQVLNRPKLGLQAVMNFGLELPNGKTEFNTAGIANTLGSKSWDPTIGTQFYLKRSDWLFSFASQYKWTTSNSKGIDQGDNASVTLTSARKLMAISNTNYAASLGILGIWSDKQRENQTVNAHSGGLRTFFTCGVAIQQEERFKASFNAHLPAVEWLNGQQNHSHIFASMAFTFFIQTQKNKP